MSSGNFESTGISRPPAFTAASTRSPVEKPYCIWNAVCGQAVAQEVLEQQLAETAARLRRAQRLLETGEILRALEHLRGGAVDLAEPLVDLGRRLLRALEATVDLRVELAEPAVERLTERLEPAVDGDVALARAGGRSRR